MLGVQRVFQKCSCPGLGGHPPGPSYLRGGRQGQAPPHQGHRVNFLEEGAREEFGGAGAWSSSFLLHEVQAEGARASG